MRFSLFFIPFFFCGTCLAHPVDREREREPHLGLDDDAFFQCFVEHWHCRRTLEGIVTTYALEVGKQRARREDLGLSYFPGDSEILDYFQLVPAEPITESPGDILNCEAHTLACHDTMKIFEERLNYLVYLNTFGAAAVTERINKPAPVCPTKKPPRR